MRRIAKEAEQSQLRDLRPVEDVFDRILTMVIDLDPETEFATLRMGLKLSESGSAVSATSPGGIQDALEEVQDMARRAHDLYCHVVVHVERSTIDLRIIESSLRERASAQLSEERGMEVEYDEKGKVSKKPKQITEKDVGNYMDTHFTDEVRALEAKRVGNRLIQESADELFKRWRDRARTLETLAGNRRGRGTFDGG